MTHKEMLESVNEVAEMTRAVNQIPESVASIPRNVAAARVLDRNQEAILRTAKQQFDAAATARKHLEMLRASGLF